MTQQSAIVAFYLPKEHNTNKITHSSFIQTLEELCLVDTNGKNLFKIKSSEQMKYLLLVIVAAFPSRF